MSQNITSDSKMKPFCIVTAETGLHFVSYEKLDKGITKYKQSNTNTTNLALYLKKN